jgi:hypothetical protein
MNRVEQLEKQVAELNPSELKAFREWFDRYDTEHWDRQMEADASSRKLSGLVELALRDHKAGHSTKL